MFHLFKACIQSLQEKQILQKYFLQKPQFLGIKKQNFMPNQIVDIKKL